MTLGNVGKASYSEFAGKRKLLIVPYVVATRVDEELVALICRYWADALAQVRKLEIGLGEVRHLFHEGSVGEGGDALEVLQLGNPAGFPHLKALLDRGTRLEPTEDVEVLKETLDLHRCMSVVESSEPVMRRLIEWFEDCRQRRYAAIAVNVARLTEENTVAMLVISPDHEVTFPDGIGVIYVVPPVLDRINVYLRDHAVQAEEQPDEPPAPDDETPSRAR
jgi:hypothetical protein